MTLANPPAKECDGHKPPPQRGAIPPVKVAALGEIPPPSNIRLPKSGQIREYGPPLSAAGSTRDAAAQMGVDLPETTSKIDGPLVKQFSVFLPNKVGAMLDVVKMLNGHEISMVALSVSESTDSAIARIVVSDPDGAQDLFQQNNIAFGVSEV